MIGTKKEVPSLVRVLYGPFYYRYSQSVSDFKCFPPLNYLLWIRIAFLENLPEPWELKKENDNYRAIDTNRYDLANYKWLIEWMLVFAQRFMESPRAKHRILTEGNIWGKIISTSLKNDWGERSSLISSLSGTTALGRNEIFPIRNDFSPLRR